MYIYIDIFMYRIPDSKIYSTVTCKIIDPTCVCIYITHFYCQCNVRINRYFCS